MNSKLIKANFSPCKSCEGEGFKWVHSHDCWGAAESYQRQCCSCNGLGFVIDKKFKKEIRKQLGLPNIW